MNMDMYKEILDMLLIMLTHTSGHILLDTTNMDKEVDRLHNLGKAVERLFDMSFCVIECTPSTTPQDVVIAAVRQGTTGGGDEKKSGSNKQQHQLPSSSALPPNNSPPTNQATTGLEKEVSQFIIGQKNPTPSASAMRANNVHEEGGEGIQRGWRPAFTSKQQQQQQQQLKTHIKGKFSLDFHNQPFIHIKAGDPRHPLQQQSQATPPSRHSYAPHTTPNKHKDIHTSASIEEKGDISVSTPAPHVSSGDSLSATRNVNIPHRKSFATSSEYLRPPHAVRRSSAGPDLKHHHHAAPAIGASSSFGNRAMAESRVRRKARKAVSQSAAPIGARSHAETAVIVRESKQGVIAPSNRPQQSSSIDSTATTTRTNANEEKGIKAAAAAAGGEGGGGGGDMADYTLGATSVSVGNKNKAVMRTLPHLHPHLRLPSKGMDRKGDGRGESLQAAPPRKLKSAPSTQRAQRAPLGGGSRFFNKTKQTLLDRDKESFFQYRKSVHVDDAQLSLQPVRASFATIWLVRNLHLAPAETQLYLLQAMARRIIHVDSRARQLPEYHRVIATRKHGRFF